MFGTGLQHGEGEGFQGQGARGRQAFGGAQKLRHRGGGARGRCDLLGQYRQRDGVFDEDIGVTCLWVRGRANGQHRHGWQGGERLVLGPGGQIDGEKQSLVIAPIGTQHPWLKWGLERGVLHPARLDPAGGGANMEPGRGFA